MTRRILPAVSILLPALASLCLAQPSQRTVPAATPNATRPPEVKGSTLASRRWIWARDSAPLPETAFFRQPFTLSDVPAMARLRIDARDPFTVYVNGNRALARDMPDTEQTLFVTRYLRKGHNALAFECLNTRGPGGLSFDLSIRFKDGREVTIVSRQTVRVSRDPLSGWQNADFDDSRWARAAVVAQGASPAGAARPAANPQRMTPAVQKPAPVASAIRQPAVNSDPSRLVRVWDIYAGGAQGEDAYARRRKVGERMLLSANVPALGDMALLHSAGFTLLQTDSDHLSTEETAPGAWDLRRPDAALRLSAQNGFDWCYFPHFAFPPAWYDKQVPYTRIRCLEHNKDVQAFSPWEPKFGAYLSRGYEKLAQKYGQSAPEIRIGGNTNRSTASGAMANALYLGVHGDYGEAGFLMGARTSVPGQREEWQRRFGDLHDHIGWWCADPLSLAAFRIGMARKYGDIEALNDAWNTKFSSFDRITYPTSPANASRRCWLDFVHWYLDSGSNTADSVCRTARRSFPQTLLMLPAGFGDENPRGGNDNSVLAKVAARNRVDLRSTHGGYKPFAENQATMLGRLASAARFYGTPFWTEAPSKTTPEGEVGRIFEAASQGSKGFFDWADNVKSGRDAFYRYGKYLRVEKPVVDVAMFYPTTNHLLHPDEGYPQTFAKGCAAIRDVLNYDTVDERMIADGALDRYRVLVLWEGTVVEAETLARIREWVQAGGVLAAYDFGKIETVEGDRSWFSDLFGYTGRLKPATSLYRFDPVGALPDRYRISVGDPAQASFMAGDWFEPDKQSGVTRRWTGANAEVRVPVVPGKVYTLFVRASVPVEAASLKREVLVNGRRVGELDRAGETTYSFAIPASALSIARVATIGFRSQTWIPAKVLPGNTDNRELGAWVSYVQMDATPNAAASLTDPGAPQGQMESEVDYERLRNEWARPFGRGWTVYFPATKAQLPGYYEVVRYLTYHLSDLDRTKEDAISVDDAWDGLYATLLSDKILYYNPTAKPIKRTIVLSPEAFAGRTDVERPRTFTETMTVEPNSIAAFYFDTQPQEMLLQCEKFTGLGRLKPLEGGTFSPGRGVTHVLIPQGGSITTRFQCDVSGRYRVFYRAIRRGRLARAEVTLDGLPMDDPDGATPNGETMLAGAVELTQGVHTLALRPRKGEDLRADFVLLTNDPTIAGYGFGVK